MITFDNITIYLHLYLLDLQIDVFTIRTVKKVLILFFNSIIKFVTTTLYLRFSIVIHMHEG